MRRSLRSRSARFLLAVFLTGVVATSLPVAPAAAETPPEPTTPEARVEAPKAETPREGWTESSHWWTNPDGTKSLEVTAGRSWFQDEARRWQKIDLDLVLDGAGRFHGRTVERRDVRGQSERRPQVRFATEARGQIATTATPAGVLGFAYPGADDVSAAVEQGHTLRFADALSAGRDITVRLTIDGFKDTVVVPDATGGPSYDVDFTLPAGVVAEQDGANIQFLDSAGAVVATYGNGIAFDDAPAQGKPYAEAPVAVTLVSQDAHGARARVSVAEAWFYDPARVFPVTIDPEKISNWYTTNSCRNVTYASTFYGCDTYVNSDNPTRTAEHETQLRVGSPGFTEPSTTLLNRTRTLLQFHMDSGFNNTNMDVIDSDVSLYTYGGAGGSRWIHLHGVAGSWGAGTSWSNQPGGDDPLYGRDSYSRYDPPGAYSKEYFSSGAVGGARRVTFDANGTSNSVKVLADRWARGLNTNYGQVRIEARDERDTAAYRQFYSNDYGYTYAPKLYIKYWEQASAPRNVTATGGVERATLSWQRPEFDGYNIVEYELLRYTSGGTYLDSKFWYCAPGCSDDGPSSTYSYTWTGISSPGDYKFKVRARSNLNDGNGDLSLFSNTVTATDGTAPAPPSLTCSTHPSGSKWYANDDPSFSWSASDISGIAGYSYVLDQVSGTNPPASSMGTATSTSYVDRADGTWWFHVRAVDGAGNWGQPSQCQVNIDDTAPAAPAVSSSTHPDQAAWYASNDPALSWSASDTSGISGYSYVLDGSSTTTPDTTSEGTATTKTYTDLADGTWWFHVRAMNGPGMWGETRHFRLNVDATKPASPSISSLTHADQATWYAHNDPAFEWSAGDTSGITGYAYELNQTEGYTPPVPATPSTETTKAYTDVSDGTWWFHVRARNGAGTWGDAAHYRVNIEAGGPAAPVVESSSHTSQTTWYSNANVALSWSTPTLSGVNGWSYEFNPDPATTPDEISEGVANSGDFVRSTGEHLFHVRARTSTGMWGDTGRRTVRVDIDAPVAPPTARVTSCHALDIASSRRPISVEWDAASDVGSGVATYHWAFTQSTSATIAQATSFQTADVRTASSSTTLAEGIWYFHGFAKDAAGNYSQRFGAGPFVIEDDAPECLATSLLNVPVAQSDQMGLEQFYAYASHALGGGDSAYVNLASGNLVASFDDTNVPAVGLNAVVRHVYNAGRATADEGLGAGWTLSVGDFDAGADEATEGELADGLAIGISEMQIGVADIYGTLDGAYQAIGMILELTDGDGTTHRFVRAGLPGTRWDSPPGVDLRVVDVRNPSTGLVVGFDLVRADGVAYRATSVSAGTLAPVWRVTSVTDRRGNRLDYDYVAVGSPTQVLRLASISHSGVSTGPLVRLEWDANTARLNRIVSLPGVTGPDPVSATTRSYERWVSFAYEGARLATVTENDHLPADDAGRRVTTYGYDTSGVLTSVTDGRVHKTTFGHSSTVSGTAVATVNDRRQKVWGYDFASTNPETNQPATRRTAPSGATTFYELSRRGDPAADESPAGPNVVVLTDAGSGSGSEFRRGTWRYGWEGNRLVTSTDPANATTRRTYDSLGLLATITEPAPNAARADLAAGAPTTEVTSRLTYAYPGGNAWSGCDAATASASTSIGSEGYCATHAELVRLAAADSVADQRRITDFGYDAEGNLVRETRRSSSSFAGAPSDAPTTGDRVATHTFDGDGRRLSADGPQAGTSDTTTFGSYDRTGQPTTVTDGYNKTTTIVYSPYGQALQVTDRDGRITKSRLDERDNRVEAHEADGDVWSWRYDPNDNPVAMTTPRGSATATVDDYTTSATYDETDNLIQASEPGATATDPRRMTTFVYDDDGRRASDTTPKGATTNYGWWPNGLLRSVDAPAGSATQRALTEHSYDAAGRLSLVRLPEANAAGVRPTIARTYSPAGLEAASTETASGGQSALTKTAYNAHGEAIQVLGPRSASDSLGTISAETLHDYTVFGQESRLRRRNGRDDVFLTTTYGYDPAGNRRSITQSTGAGASLTTSYTFDRLNRLEKQANDPVNPGHTVEFTYDGEGNQTARIDKANDVEQRRVTMAYNLDGSLRSNVATQAGSHLAECHFAEGAAVDSGYDDDGHPLVVRTLSGTADCTGGTLISSSSFGWDDRGFMATATQAAAGTSGVVTKQQSFAYDADGARTSFTHDGRSVTYGRSPAGWATSVTDWRNVTSTASYLPSGAVATEARGADANATYGYDGDGSLASLRWAKAGGSVVRSHTGITYDAGGMKTAEQVSTLGVGAQTPAGGQALLTHDLAGRLTSWTSPYGDRLKTTYALDDGGNVTRELVADHTGVTRKDDRYSYTNGRLSTKTSQDFDGLKLLGRTCESFEYSDLGEEKKRSTVVADISTDLTGCSVAVSTTETSSTYDPAGYVNTVDSAAGAPADVDYAYDLADRVISRTAAEGDTTLYFYDPGTGRLVQEVNGAGEPMVGYLLGAGGEPLAHETWRTDDPTARASAPTWVWLLADADGNIGTHLQDNGEVLEQAAYDPYGKGDNSEPSERKTGYAGSSLGYQSDLTDAKTKKLLLGPRQYDTSTLRFTTPDTFVSSQLDVGLGVDDLTGNRYLFAAANPVAFYEDGHRPREYQYRDEFDLGPGGAAPAGVMNLLMRDFGDPFPFSGCGRRLRLNEICKLRLATVRAPVKVVAIGATSFTFRSLEGHPEGRDRLITFSFHRVHDRLVLRVFSRGPAKKWFYRFAITRGGNRTLARAAWAQLARNMRREIYAERRALRGFA